MSRIQMITKKQENPIQTYFNNKMEALLNHRMPEDAITEKVKYYTRKALEHTSYFKCDTSPVIYEVLVKFHRPIMMPDAELMINLISATSPKEYGITLDENLEMLNEVYTPLIRVFDEEYKKVCTDVAMAIIERIPAYSGTRLTPEILEEASKQYNKR